MFGIQVSLYFHQFIVNNYNFSKHCYFNYYILLQRTTCYNHCFSRSFCLLSVFSRGFCWRRLMLSILLFHLTASSRPGFPYSPFSSNALSSGAIAKPSPVQTSKSKLLYIQKDPLGGAASFFLLTVLQIKDLPR
jgi:hypothetical protein